MLNRKIPLQLFVVLFIILILGIPGLKWGIPSRELKNYYFSEEKDILEITRKISTEDVRDSWLISKGESARDKFPRSTFNIIRSFHPDEQNIIKSIANMKPEKFDFNPHFFEYPTLHIYLVAISLKFLSLLKIITLKADLGFYFLNPEEIGKMYIAGRSLTLLLSIMGVFFLYKIGMKLYDKKTAFLSSLILAICPAYTLNSHYMSVDIPMVFWIITSIYFLSSYLKDKMPLWLYISGFTIGFATSTKYPAIFLWFLIPFVNFLCNRKIFSKEVLFSSITLIVGFLITSPYVFLSFPEFKRDFIYQCTTRGATLSLTSNKIVLWLYNTSIAFKTGFYSLIITFVLGIIYAFVKRTKEDKFLIAGLFFSLIPLLIISGFKYTRYYLPLLPFLVILSARFIAPLFSLKKETLLTSVIILVILLTAFLKSLSYSKLMSGVDTRLRAAEYISKNISEGSHIVFTEEPWIFQVPPVNNSKYHVEIIQDNKFEQIPKDSYLVIGELQYYLATGSRRKMARALIQELEKKHIRLVTIFRNKPQILGIDFTEDVTLHDILYIQPQIFIFQKI